MWQIWYKFQLLLLQYSSYISVQNCVRILFFVTCLDCITYIFNTLKECYWISKFINDFSVQLHTQSKTLVSESYLQSIYTKPVNELKSYWVPQTMSANIWFQCFQKEICFIAHFIRISSPPLFHQQLSPPLILISLPSVQKV